MNASDRLSSTFGYVPTTGDSTKYLESGVFEDLLLVGAPITDATLAVPDIRQLETAPNLPSGTYWFGGLDRPALAIVRNGAPPGSPASIDAAAATGSALDDAFGWFEHYWDTATPISQPLFAVLDHVVAEATGVDGIVRHRQYVEGAWFYSVFIGGRTQTLTESALAEMPALDTPDAWINTPPEPVDRFAATLTRAKLEKEFTDTVFSFRATRTVFRPYQFRPVMKLLNGGTLRLLIADEVGLGKTIEAGLLWTELEARRQADRVLVVCPSALTTKWRREMEERFGFDLIELDSAGLRALSDQLDTGRVARRAAYVCSISRLRRWEGLRQATDLGLHFDLVIVDEAHQFRNAGTKSHALGEHLSQWAESLVFLSATPVNLRNRDLFNLLELLVPGEFVDVQSLEERLEPNRELHQLSASLLDPATTNAERRSFLVDATQSVFGRVLARRPEYALLMEILGQEVLSPEAISRAKRLITELHGLSAQVTRTRKAEVEENKSIRQTDSRLVAWSDAEHAFYEAFREWCVERADAQGMPLHFSMQMPLRLAGSCLPQAAAYVRTWSGSGDVRAETDSVAQKSTRSVVDDVPPGPHLRQLADGLREDTKLGVFNQAIDELLERGTQALVFTFSRRTLDYLSANLRSRCRVAELHGGVDKNDRDRIMAAFRAGAYDVVLATKVASEGLDFEFCSTLINYDLPWNPMEIEQRIGRIDRIGQLQPKMLIINFTTPGTIETDILERVLDRIGVFEQTIGELEPIVEDMWAEVERGLIDFSLTAEQRSAVERQTLTAIETRREALAEVESAAPMLISSDGADIEGLEPDLMRTGRYVGQRELALLVSDWMQTYGGWVRAEGDALTIVGNAEVANHVQQLVRRGERTLREVTDVVTDLRQERPIYLSLDQEESRTGALPLLATSHPLVRAALSVPLHRQARFSAATIPSAEGRPPGHYLVLMATATWSGIRNLHEVWTETVDLASATSVQDVGDAVMAAIAEGSLNSGTAPPQAALDHALSVASAALMARQLRREAQLMNENAAFAETRRLSAEQVHQRRLDVIDERISTLRARGRSERMVALQESQRDRQRIRHAALLHDLEQRSAAALSVEPMAVCLVEVK